MAGFEELLAVCRRRRRMKWLKGGAAALLAVLALGSLQWYRFSRTQTTPAPSRQVSPPPSKPAAAEGTAERAEVKASKTPSMSPQKATTRPAKVRAVPKKTKVADEVRVLQFVTTRKKYRAAARQKAQALERAGLACYIKESADGRSLYVRCLPPSDPHLLDRIGSDYFYVSESADYLRRLALTKGALKTKAPKTVKTDSNPRRVDNTASTAPSKESAPSGEFVSVAIRQVEDSAALKRRFERYPKFDTALKIARIAFREKRFEEAARWARRANALNRDDERAWILYARAEYAMGRKERAKRILKLFLDYKTSTAAEALLSEWSRR